MDSAKSIVIATVIILCIFFLGWVAIKAEKDTTWLTNSSIKEAGKQINVGMSKEEVINLLGTSYTRSVLKSGEEKLEWRVRNGGTSYSYGKGVRGYSPSMTRRLIIYFIDDKVSRFSGINLD